MTVGVEWFGSSLAGIAVTEDGLVLAAAHFEGTVDFDPGPGVDERTGAGRRTSFLWRLTIDGEYVETIVFGTSEEGSSVATAVAVDAAGNAYVTGNFRGTVDFDPGPGTDEHSFVAGSFVTKFAADGSYVWTRSFGSSEFNAGKSIAVDPAGNVLVGGEFRGEVDFDPGAGQDLHVALIPGATYLTKLTPDGEQVWTRTWQIRPNEVPFAVGPEGDIWLTGSYTDAFGNFVIDFDPTEGVDAHPAEPVGQIFVTNLTSDGAYGGTWLFPSTDSSRGQGITVGPGGQIVVAGYFSGTMDFDPGLPSLIRNSVNGGWDAFVAAFDIDSTPAWLRSFYGPLADRVNRVTETANGELYGIGVFAGAMDVDPGCGLTSLGRADDTQAWVFRLGCIDPTADADGDGIVELRDVAAFFHCFSDAGSPESPAVCPQGCYPFDFDQDDDIDLDDYAAFFSALTAE